MSRLRLHQVTKARNDQGTCPTCHTAIKAGDPYVWFQPFRQAKRIRCANPGCKPKPWELESNPVLANLVQAQSIVEGISNEDTAPDAAQALRDAIDLVQESHDTLDERVSAWGETNLQYSQAYADTEQAVSDLYDWISSTEDVATTLEGLEEPGDDADADTLEDHQAEVEGYISQVEEVPSLDI